MFEVTDSDIERLSDAELRSLVVRLATSELRKHGLPLSSITAGGHQDAPDGGLDVRVACPIAIPSPDFVPRQHTGFQVKKPDMTAGKIRDEMSPGGKLRAVITDLATQRGAYIIVSAQGSVADKPLQERRQAMRDQLIGLMKPEDLHTDFYDRDRLTTWVNEYPGIAAWVRAVVGRPLDGWSSIDHWSGAHSKTPYLTDTSTCLVDESRKPGEALQLLEGVERLRVELRRAGRCIRLIGLSGLGKTRLVQALFEADVGKEPLNPGLAVYTDYSVETRPSARDMARMLIARGGPAILIVDNCNPETHSELARLCAEPGVPISLLTVEYDVREDEPEHTDVFRIQAASNDLLEKWLEQNFDYISQVDRRTIAKFSHGNFRVARALAETLKRGETLGKVKSRDLFERIFRQRNSEDRSLLMAAEDLALAYSINGEDIGSDGELASLSAIRGITVQTLFESIAELRKRDVAQARGRWRAILPQAIANELASNALTRIHHDKLDDLMRSASSRLRVSISRRLGNLHDSPEARAAAARWLNQSGALGDLFDPSGDHLQVVTNLAPLAPAEVLLRIGDTVESHPEIADSNSHHRWAWIRLIKALGYEAEHFGTAVQLLAQFIVAEPEDNRSNSARDAFAEMFHLYLSGTQAVPEIRYEAAEAMLTSGVPAFQSCGLLALKALLKTDSFSSFSNFDFGARSRSWGWHPKLNRDVWNWYVQAIVLCTKAAERLEEPRRILAGSLRGLWRHAPCRDALEDAAGKLLQNGPWIEGWIALRATLRYDGQQMPDEIRNRLEALIERLKPVDLLNRARAAVLGRGTDGWDVSDGESDDGKAVRAWHKADLMAQGVGRELASHPAAREAFMAELVVTSGQNRAFYCGRGLAEGTSDLDEMWTLLLEDFEKAVEARRNTTVLGGFLSRSQELDYEFAQRMLENAMSRTSLLRSLVYLQAQVGIDKLGIERLRRSIASQLVEAHDFIHIANGVIEHSPPSSLAELLADIATLPDGDIVALDILHMYFFSNKSVVADEPPSLLDVGRKILSTLDLTRLSDHHAYGIAEVIRTCCAGSGHTTAVDFASRLKAALEVGDIHFYKIRELVTALCEVQAQIVLDVFVLPPHAEDVMWRWDMGGLKGLPYRVMGAAEIQSWASADPEVRYAQLGPAMPLFSSSDFEEGAQIDPLFQNLLHFAPDKKAFLGAFEDRVRPSHWQGSFKSMLEKRRIELVRLANEMPGQVANWVNQGLPELDRWIHSAGDMDRDQEESFE